MGLKRLGNVDGQSEDGGLVGVKFPIYIFSFTSFNILIIIIIIILNKYTEHEPVVN